MDEIKIEISSCESNEEKIKLLNELIKKRKVEVTYDNTYLIFECKDKKNERGAGRKRKVRNSNEDLLAILEEHTKDEAAKILGISKRTLYRRIKEIEEKERSNMKTMQAESEINTKEQRDLQYKRIKSYQDKIGRTKDQEERIRKYENKVK